MLLGLLSDFAFEAFEETTDGLRTSLAHDLWSQGLENKMRALQSTYPFSVEAIVQEDQNWNEIWESSFSPISIGDFCTIRAPFHAPGSTSYEVLIEPRMAFGTGHHETTRLMIQSMERFLDRVDNVCDFGAGSGVLGILAHKVGASAVMLLESDPQAFVNMEENVQLNDVEAECVCVNNLSGLSMESYSMVLANITRNILLEHGEDLAKVLFPSGVLILSGFLSKDLGAICDHFEKLSLRPCLTMVENEWIAQSFIKPI